MTELHIRDERISHDYLDKEQLIIIFPVLCGLVIPGDLVIYPDEIYAHDPEEICLGCACLTVQWDVENGT